MAEIAIFKVYKADARILANGGLEVNLFYPRNPEVMDQRLFENLPVMEERVRRLLAMGETSLASPEVPFRTADGGSGYVLSDGVVLFHRRDWQRALGPGINSKRRVHEGFHGAPGGYTDSLDSTYSEQGLLETAIRETSEENLLVRVMNNGKIKLIVPRGYEKYTLKAAKDIGLECEPEFVDAEEYNSNDILNVFYEDGTKIFSSEGKGMLDIMGEGGISISLIRGVGLPVSSEDVFPIDAEGMFKKDRSYLRFNRESYFARLKDLANKPFGTPLENIRVYQTKITNGKPEFYTPEIQEPFWGPDGILVKHPHIWAPENHLTVFLDLVGVEGYKGRRLHNEYAKIRTKLEGKSLVPQEFLL